MERALLAHAVGGPDDRRDGAGLQQQDTIETDDGTFQLRIKRYDTGLSATPSSRQRATGDRRRCGRDHGAREPGSTPRGGTRATRTARSALRTRVARTLSNPVERPNVFRVAPTDHGTALRLADLLDPEGTQDRARGRRLGLRPGRRQGTRRVLCAEPGSGRDQPDRAGRLGRPRSRGPPREASQRHGSPRLGPAGRRSPAFSRRHAPRAGTSPSTRRLPARTRTSRSPGACTPSRMGGRPHVRGGRADGRGGARASGSRSSRSTSSASASSSSA